MFRKNRVAGDKRNFNNHLPGGFHARNQLSNQWEQAVNAGNRHLAPPCCWKTSSSSTQTSAERRRGRALGKAPAVVMENGGGNMAGWEIPYKWKVWWEHHQTRLWIFHCHVWLSDGESENHLQTGVWKGESSTNGLGNNFKKTAILRCSQY